VIRNDKRIYHKLERVFVSFYFSMYLLLFLNLWMNEWRLLERKRQLQSQTKWRNKSCYIFEQRKQAAPIKVGVLCSLNRRRQRQRRSKKQRTDDLRKARPSRCGKTTGISQWIIVEGSEKGHFTEGGGIIGWTQLGGLTRSVDVHPCYVIGILGGITRT